MLQRSFVHLPGIGISKEQTLWNKGILNWNDLVVSAPKLFQGFRLEGIQALLERSQEALEKRDAHFFYENLPRPEIWRLVPDFFEDIAFLDIETNGLNLPPHSQSTTITFYFRGQVYQEFERAKKEALICKMCDEAAIFCTYFGESFDVPFLRREFRLPIKKAQIDLCFWLKRLGYKGGLKKVEKAFSDTPFQRSRDIDGFDAVRLWRWHEEGRSGALQTLLHYNAEDTVVLEGLLIKAFNLEIEARKHLAATPYGFRPVPALATAIDEGVYQALREGPPRSSAPTRFISVF